MGSPSECRSFRAAPASLNALSAISLTVSGMTSLCFEAGNFSSVSFPLSYRTPASDANSAFPPET